MGVAASYLLPRRRASDSPIRTEDRQSIMLDSRFCERFFCIIRVDE